MERNEALIKEVADRIEKEPEHYYQRSWIYYDPSPYCHTTACIAGWAWVVKTGRQLKEISQETVYATIDEIRCNAGDYMGLDSEDWIVLFDSAWEPHEGLSVPDALRKIAEGANIADVSKQENVIT